jgi:hypothetical protein
MLAVAYRSLSYTTANTLPPQYDLFNRGLLFSAFLFFAVMCVVMVKRAVLAWEWDMSRWAVVFPLDVLTIACVQYHVSLGKPLLTEIFCWILLICAAVSSLVLLCQTLYHITKRSGGVFRPVEKWGPMSWMIITHKAFNVSIKKINMMLGELQKKGDDKEAYGKVIKVFKGCSFLLQEHARLEDNYFFPMLEFYFSGVSQRAHGEHEEDHGVFAEVTRLFKALEAADSTG